MKNTIIVFLSVLLLITGSYSVFKHQESVHVEEAKSYEARCNYLNFWIKNEHITEYTDDLGCRVLNRETGNLIKSFNSSEEVYQALIILKVSRL